MTRTTSSRRAIAVSVLLTLGLSAGLTTTAYAGKGTNSKADRTKQTERKLESSTTDDPIVITSDDAKIDPIVVDGGNDPIVATTDDPLVVTTDDGLAVVTAEVTPEVHDVDDVPTLLADVVTQIGADDMWSAGFTGAGVDVAVIDTGVAPVTELSSGNVFIGPDFSFEAPYEEVVGLDTYGHGTHMAGIIAGRTPGADPLNPRPDDFIGVAPDAGIVSVKVADNSGAVDVSQVIAAIDWVVQNRQANGLNIGVLSLSYNTTGTQPADIDPLSKAVENAWNHGIVVVVSAGNEGRSANTLANPATNPYVIAVSASKLDTEGIGIPSWAPSGDGIRNPDVLAPGKSIASLRNPGSRIDLESPKAHVASDERLFLGSGTSQSAAVVAGSAALLLDQRPDLSPDQVKGILMTSAIDLGMPVKFQGDGAIDLSAAMTTHTSPRYNQNHRPATGLGLLEEARGDDHVMRDGVPFVGEFTVAGVAWDGPAWVVASEAANAWPVDSTLSGWSWSGWSWSGWSWSGWSWSGWSWSGSSWSGWSWSGSSWSGSSWSGSSWS